MAIREFEGFANGLPPSGVRAVSTGTPIPGISWVAYGGTTAIYGQPAMQRWGGNGFYMALNSATTNSINRQNTLQRALADLLQQPTLGVITGGARLMLSTDWLGKSFFGIWSEALPSGYGLCTADKVFATGVQPTEEFYFEWQLDFVAKAADNLVVCKFRVNGKDIESTELGINSFTNFKTTGRVLFGLPWSTEAMASKSYTFVIKDIYIVEKTDDGPDSTFLGPIRLNPITVKSVDAPWTVVGISGSAVDSLNTTMLTTANLSSPTLRSDTAGTTGNIGLTCADFTGQVVGVSITASVMVPSGTTGKIKASLKTGGAESPPASIPLSTNFQYGLEIFSAAKAPNGANWTKALLESSTLKLSAVA